MVTCLLRCFVIFFFFYELIFLGALFEKLCVPGLRCFILGTFIFPFSRCLGDTTTVGFLRFSAWNLYGLQGRVHEFQFYEETSYD